MSLPDLSHLAIPGARICLRATPNAASARIEVGPDGLRVQVTVTPEGGKANAAVAALLAKAMGVAKSRLTLIRGATSRDKVFVLDAGSGPGGAYSSSSAGRRR